MGTINRTSRLALPQVTLIAVDAFQPKRTVAAINFTLRLATFAGATLITSTECGDLGVIPSPLKVFHVNNPATRQRTWREEFWVKNLANCFDTSHCLHMEWDAGIGNPRAWDPAWLDYDFIGAPWPWPYQDKTCSTPCTAENCVGNTGFALFSRRFCAAVAGLAHPTPAELTTSDAYVCRTLRPALEKLGMRFAPESVAEAFSCENRIYSGQFGFHGRGTIRLNGWNWPL